MCGARAVGAADGGGVQRGTGGQRGAWKHSGPGHGGSTAGGTGGVQRGTHTGMEWWGALVLQHESVVVRAPEPEPEPVSSAKTLVGPCVGDSVGAVLDVLLEARAAVGAIVRAVVCADSRSG